MDIETIKTRVRKYRSLNATEGVQLVDEIERLEKALAKTEKLWREERAKAHQMGLGL